MHLLSKAAAAVRLHWRTIRLQLALLYAGVFVALGAALLGVCALVALLVGGGLAVALVLPSWAAALAMGGGFVLIAGILALVGKRAVSKGSPPVPREAIAGLKSDLALVKKAKP